MPHFTWFSSARGFSTRVNFCKNLAKRLRNAAFIVLLLRRMDCVVIEHCLVPRNGSMLKPTLEVKQKGDEAARTIALRSLFDSEEGPLLRYAFSLTGRRAVAEDIVQEAFLKLHSDWEKVDEPRAWIFRAVRNRAFNYLRKSKREVLLGPEDGSASDDAGDATPEAMMQRMETIGALRQMLSELDEADQQIVKLKYFQNLKYREISERTGLTVGNVGYRLHHILKQLGDKLRPLGIDE